MPKEGTDTKSHQGWLQLICTTYYFGHSHLDLMSPFYKGLWVSQLPTGRKQPRKLLSHRIEPLDGHILQCLSRPDKMVKRKADTQGKQ